jgi:hypothetical protein
MPSEEEVDDFIEAINMKYPALTNCWGAMDGLKVWLEKAGNSQIQNIFFNVISTSLTFFFAGWEDKSMLH